MVFDDFLFMHTNMEHSICTISVLQSGEVITPYTLKAEMASSFYTDINIPINLTEAEAGLMGNT